MPWWNMPYPPVPTICSILQSEQVLFYGLPEEVNSKSVNLLGSEIYPDILQQALYGGLSEDDLGDVEVRDFVF